MSADTGLAPAAHVLVDLLVALATLVVLPLGLRLIDGVPDLMVRGWPVLALPGVACLWLPRGPLAVALACCYAAATTALALAGSVRWWRRVRPTRPGHTLDRHALDRHALAVEGAVLTGLATPLVGAVALVAERAGHRLFGFELDILALTVPHLHYAGFAAALVAALAASHARRGAGPDRAATTAAALVPAGTLLVLLGYFVSDAAELLGAAVLTAGMWLVSWLTWTRIRPGAAGASRVLLAVSSAVLAATMALALSWALGQVTGLPHLDLTWMVATHGLVNALGFALCAVLAWRLILVEER